eukprot:jgi/Botrbrau1/23443/Bobra.106_1s0004.1
MWRGSRRLWPRAAGRAPSQLPPTWRAAEPTSLLGGNPEFMARLKLREKLMPEVVSQVETLEKAASSGAKAPRLKSWAVSPELFQRELSPETVKLMAEAVEDAKQAWGPRQLPELEAEERLAIACEKGPTSDPVIGKLRAAFQAAEAEYKEVTDAAKEEVVSLGGLHVIGTERHESRRIDNQLRGRSGRQGDPGSTRYFLSLEDNLFRVFGGDRIKGLMSVFNIEDLPIESKMLTDALNEAQRKVEAYFFDIRRQLWEYDQVLNTQRDKVYLERRKVLQANDLSALLVEYAERTVDDIVGANVDAAVPSTEWNLEALAAKMQQYCSLLTDLTPELLQQESGGNYEQLRNYLRKRGVDAYYQKAKEVDAVEKGLMLEAQRFFILAQTDNLWKEHLQAMRFLQQAVGLRGYAQRDPLAEYKLEGYNLFLEMMAQIRRNVIYNVYVFRPQKPVAKKEKEKQETEEKATVAA